MISPRTAQEYLLARERRRRRRIAGVGCDGGRRTSPTPTCSLRSAPASTSATSGTAISRPDELPRNRNDPLRQLLGRERQIVAPLNVMRFDDSLFRVLGDNLEALTQRPELLVDPQTYDGRSTSSARLPGALVREFSLTL
jgi:hypothetical protein